MYSKTAPLPGAVLFYTPLCSEPPAPPITCI